MDNTMSIPVVIQVEVWGFGNISFPAHFVISYNQSFIKVFRFMIRYLMR